MRKILIVDLHARSAQHLIDHLPQLPYETLHLPFLLSPAAITRYKPAVIVARYYLYGGFAESLCKIVKQAPALYRVPVILLSDTTYVGHIARECRADHYFVDPIDMLILHHTILSSIKPEEDENNII